MKKKYIYNNTALNFTFTRWGWCPTSTFSFVFPGVVIFWGKEVLTPPTTNPDLGLDTIKCSEFSGI